jgi:hypothetical protein
MQVADLRNLLVEFNSQRYHSSKRYESSFEVAKESD